MFTNLGTALSHTHRGGDAQGAGAVTAVVVEVEAAFHQRCPSSWEKERAELGESQI